MHFLAAHVQKASISEIVDCYKPNNKLQTAYTMSKLNLSLQRQQTTGNLLLFVLVLGKRWSLFD